SPAPGPATIAANAGAVTWAAPTDTATATAGALLTRDASAVTLWGPLPAPAPAGRLTIGAAGPDRVTGNVTQTSGLISAAGDTSVNAGGTVALNQPFNDFNTVTVNAGNGVLLRDLNDITLTAVTTAAGNVTVNAP